MKNLNNNAEDRFVVSDKDIKWGINGQQKTEEEILLGRQIMNY